MKRLFGVLMSVIFISLITSMTWASEAVITMLKGEKAEILQKGSPNWIPAKNGLALVSGDKIRTGKKTRLLLVSKEGHKLLIKQKTIFEISKLGPQDWEFIEEVGQVRIRTDALKAGQSLKVNTPTAVCSVRGTDFIVTYVKDKNTMGRTICDVYKGEVGFAHALQGFPEVKISENHRSTIDPFTPPTQPQPIPKEEKVEDPEITGKEKEAAEEKEEEKKEEEKKTEEPKPILTETGIWGPTTGPAGETGKELESVSSSQP